MTERNTKIQLHYKLYWQVGFTSAISIYFLFFCNTAPFSISSTPGKTPHWVSSDLVSDQREQWTDFRPWHLALLTISSLCVLRVKMKCVCDWLLKRTLVGLTKENRSWASFYHLFQVSSGPREAVLWFVASIHFVQNLSFCLPATFEHRNHSLNSNFKEKEKEDIEEKEYKVRRTKQMRSDRD